MKNLAEDVLVVMRGEVDVILYFLLALKDMIVVMLGFPDMVDIQFKVLKPQ